MEAQLPLRNDQTTQHTPLSLRQERFELTQAADVMQGTLDLLILKALALGPIHGWGISNRIRLLSGDAFQVGQGSLYPALHRFETRDWVASLWQTTENNRIARYYELTAAGRRALDEEIASWRFYAGAIDLVINAK
jgi:transcriptional regulator